MFSALLSALAFAALTLSPAPSHTPSVALQRVPDGGIEPEVAVDRAGTVHLIYFKGNPAAGDLFYSRSRDGITFSTPIRVNSEPGTAIAVGNIRGGRIAAGERGRVYVVWNGSRVAAAANGGRTPMLYARLNGQGTAFEPERNLIHSAYGIDGGGAVAADASGHVYVFWHAPIPGKKGEPFRRVWMTRSENNGKTFAPERIIFDQPTGACGCCSLDATTDPDGRVYVLFRSAKEIVDRDIYLLESSDHGATFTGSDIAKWNVGYCVMSSEAFASGPRGTFAAWESEKRVQFGRIDSSAARVADAADISQAADQKYPALAQNKAGDLLVAWTEGMGWNRGGSLAWRVLDPSGKAIGERGDIKGVPTWSLVAAYPRNDGQFAILY
jgi:hypothetical protein